MDANKFVANLKANGVESDKYDLAKSYNEYCEILRKLSTKDKNSFSLNVLCTLCRNLEKVSTWRERIDNKELLRLTIECVRHTRTLEGPEQVKTLACVYHVHKYVIKQNSPLPPELVLKLSFMPLEYEHDSLLKEYYKTYWSIIADRLTYIEKLKTKRMPVSKLLSRLIDDVVKVVMIYDTVLFCSTLLVFLVKKLHYIYSDLAAKELNESFRKIFECISNKDLKPFKSLSEKEALDLYVKFNDCLYIITENASKIHFKDSVLDSVTRVCISLLGHRSDIFHCFQTYFLNSFCFIFKEQTDVNLIENIFNSLCMSCEMTEKLGYKHTMHATYPFMSQLLRLFIEYKVNNLNKNSFNENIIQSNIKLMLVLLEKLKNTNQIVKCENCSVKSGLHDGLRLSFLVKHFITMSMNQNIPMMNILTTYYALVEQQYVILKDLKTLGCVNQEKCFRKLQTDVHNTAITLNKSQCYEYSIKLFEIYLQNELNNIKSDVELKNISRALYNKSICELEFKSFEESLKNAYLSLIFSLPEGLCSEKFMSLVMDIKAKALKSVTEDADSESNELQIMSVLEVCKSLYDDSCYGDLKPFMKSLTFSALLKHEFAMYVKLWPSIVPIAGVWKSLNDLVNGKHQWVKDESKETLQWTLFEIVMETPTAVRTIHDDSYREIVKQLLEHFDAKQANTFQETIVHAALMCLQSEYDIADASQKYGWKVAENTLDPEQAEVSRTVEQEHRAVSLARRAVAALSRALAAAPPRDRAETSASLVRHGLQLFQVSTQQLLLLRRLGDGLQLAHACCELAELVGDEEALLRGAGRLLRAARSRRPALDALAWRAAPRAAALLRGPRCVDAAIAFLCELAVRAILFQWRPCDAGRGAVSLILRGSVTRRLLQMYWSRGGAGRGAAARLLRAAQAHSLRAHARHEDANLQLSTGRLMEAQALLSPDSGLSKLSAVNGLQRHYLAASNNSPRWSGRRAWALAARAALGGASVRAGAQGRALRLLRRAAAAAAPALPRCSALRCALLYALCTDAARADDAQVKIDNRLKYILGLRSSSDASVGRAETPKREEFTPQREQLESMLDSMFKRTQVSPSLPCTAIPASRTPASLRHPRACECHACALPDCAIVACLICHLEASMYYRAKEFDIAQNYFDGATKAFGLAEIKLKHIFDDYGQKYDETVVEITREIAESHFRSVQLEFLIELCLFELSRGEIGKSDDTLIRIHELVADDKNIDVYLQNEISNLMVASAQLRESTKVPKETGLENELESLKLSPVVLAEPQTTPETKNAVPKTDTVVVVKAEDLPKKRKVIKLNFDDVSTEERQEKAKPKKHQFKIPVPVTSKPVLEKMTPRPTRSRPEIVIQQPSIDQSFNVFTPKSEENGEFFTPCQSTPAEQFFTPMTSMKTYSKRVVKNLEAEFSTPKGKENSQVESKLRSRSRVETGSVQGIKDKRTLKRATSPGKLPQEKPTTRSRRIRQPVLDDRK
ncbi:uncharacterized protein LOC125074562 [Vanessa atalanta]|uniref:uncharacterized protein LOC125074562 n=1 Tax=Vanessa atalanta TaxID=42275 RepID=UPI001FCE28EA|nr:uncharacterized protein LOC125074562 [Vanessa atalanta]